MACGKVGKGKWKGLIYTSSEVPVFENRALRAVVKFVALLCCLMSQLGVDWANTTSKHSQDSIKPQKEILICNSLEERELDGIAVPRQ